MGVEDGGGGKPQSARLKFCFKTQMAPIEVAFSFSYVPHYINGQLHYLVMWQFIVGCLLIQVKLGHLKTTEHLCTSKNKSQEIQIAGG